MFRGNVLPTYEEMIKMCLYSRYLEEESKNTDTAMPGIAEIVAYALEDVWHRTSIPVVGHRKIVRRIIQYHGKYRNTLRSVNKNAFIDLKQEFLPHSHPLFDVLACKCSSGTDRICEILRKCQFWNGNTLRTREET